MVLIAMLIVMVMVMMSLKTQLLLLLTPLIIGCADKEPLPPPDKVYVRDVTLVGVQFGHKAQAEIEIYDKYRKMYFRETILCDDWTIETQLKQEIGKEYKVYDLSETPIPSWYKLSSRFCH